MARPGPPTSPSPSLRPRDSSGRPDCAAPSPRAGGRCLGHPHPPGRPRPAGQQPARGVQGPRRHEAAGGLRVRVPASPRPDTHACRVSCSILLGLLMHEMVRPLPGLLPPGTPGLVPTFHLSQGRPLRTFLKRTSKVSQASGTIHTPERDPRVLSRPCSPVPPRAQAADSGPFLPGAAPTPPPRPCCPVSLGALPTAESWRSGGRGANGMVVVGLMAPPFLPRICTKTCTPFPCSAGRGLPHAAL